MHLITRKTFSISHFPFILLMIALTALIITLPLFINQSVPYIDDMFFHVFHADQFNRSIQDGILYPRWVAEANNGYGSPTFIFYAPLSYYFTSAVFFLIPSLTMSMVIVIWAGFFLSGVSMFLATTKIFGRAGGLVSAIAYQILPFHISDLYMRGTFAELLSFIWIPLIFLFLHSSLEERSKSAWLGLSLSYAGLILTHLVSGFIFTVVIGGYLIYHAVSGDRNSYLRTFFSLVIGVGLSAFYLIPVIFERKLVHIDYIINNVVGDYRKNFLFTIDKFQDYLSDFYVPVHIIAISELALLILIVLWTRRNQQEKSIISLHNFFIYLFLFSFFLTTPLSSPLWSVIPGFPFLQFPWRWMPVSEVSLCFLLGSIFSQDKRAERFMILPDRKYIIYTLIILLVVSLSIITKSISNPWVLKTGPAPREEIRKVHGPTMEYTPLWSQNLLQLMSGKNEQASVLSGNASVTVTQWKSEHRVLEINALTSSVVRISTFYYPGWKASIDGMDIPLKSEENSGAIIIDVSQGNHRIQLRFVDTSLRYYSKLLSLLSCFILVGLFLYILREEFD